jgi:hypothetical protein
MRRVILALLVVVWGWMIAPASADDAAALLTQGKLDVDLGKPQAAAKAFETVAADTAAPAPLRAEALVRLGLVRRSLGDAKGAAQAFERAWVDHGRDKDSLRLLVQAVGGTLPDEERWKTIWERVAVRVDRTDPERPLVRVEWPGVPVEPRTYRGKSIGTWDFKDADLGDILRMFADVSELNIVVHPGVRGRVTTNLRDMPWDMALDEMLRPHGLVANRVGNLVEIGPPSRLGTRRDFEGKPIDVDFKSVDLIEALRRIAEHGGRTVSAPPEISGKTTLVLKQVPWDQALDVVVRLHGLTWTMEGTAIRVGRPVGPSQR